MEQLDNADIDFLKATEGAEDEEEDEVLKAGLIVKEEPDLSKDHFSDLILDAFNALSLEDREKTTLKMYGILGGEDEENAGAFWDSPSSVSSSKSTEFIQEKLQEMDKELERIRASSAWSLTIAAIDLAESTNLAYVQNPKFRRKFLAVEQWDATKAAARFIRHFDFKMELFGPDCVARDITISDLTREEIKILKQGHLQVLPVRDTAGRAIMMGCYNGQMYTSVESAVSTSWWV